MRLVCASLLMALLWVPPMLLGTGGAAAFMGAIPQISQPAIVLEAKIVCGDFGEGYTCRREGGAIRRGKNMKVPGAGSDDSGSSSGGGWFGGSDEDPDALPPASGDTGSGSTAATSCPANTELLGGHCIPYTQSCRTDMAAGAPPQVCRNAEEKLVCNFRADGLKDCCCRTYSKF